MLALLSKSVNPRLYDVGSEDWGEARHGMESVRKFSTLTHALSSETTNAWTRTLKRRPQERVVFRLRMAEISDVGVSHTHNQLSKRTITRLYCTVLYKNITRYPFSFPLIPPTS